MNDFPWTENHPLLERTEAILRAGAQTDPSYAIAEDRWHEDAIELSRVASPVDLSDNTFTLLKHIPYNDTVTAIHDVKREHNPDIAMLQIKMARKLFFIARDIVIMTSEGSPEEEFQPLIAACRTLGEIADTKGRSGKKRAVRAIHALQDNPPSPQPLKTQSGLVAEVTNRLYSASLLRAPQVPFNVLHTARKDFRRVAALGVIGVAGLNITTYRSFAINGVALSHRHGEIKDAAFLDAL